MFKVRQTVKTQAIVFGRINFVFLTLESQKLKVRKQLNSAKLLLKRIVEFRSNVDSIRVIVQALQIVSSSVKSFVNNLHIDVYLMANNVLKSQNVMIIQQRSHVIIKIKMVTIAFGIKKWKKNAKIFFPVKTFQLI